MMEGIIMEIASALQEEFNLLNDDQREIVTHEQGPLLVIAGPGSGKTHSLTLLAMNLFLCKKAEPSQLVLCTYTEKAARELHDRITLLADQVKYKGDISQMRIGTIHSICRRILDEHLHRTPFGNNYEVLDPFTQRLLIFTNLQKLCNRTMLDLFLDSWGSPWDVAKKLQFYFDTITEELIFEKLTAAFPNIQSCNGRHPAKKIFFTTQAYNRYRQLLVETNSIDFAHILKCTHNLLQQEDTLQRITKDIRYVLVDEYQDTNYIQEKILTLLASGCTPQNMIVIGDEDQALYRFRGATVRNILSFKENFPECGNVTLRTNYRSHPRIIDTYNLWMQTFDWSNPDPYGLALRSDKTICANPQLEHVDYPSVVTLAGRDSYETAEQFVDLVVTLKQEGKIADYSEVALLLNSVRFTGNPYIEALEKRGIPVYCPRARRFFQQDEVELIIGAFARILGYSEGERVPEREESFSQSLDLCLYYLLEQCRSHPTLEEELQVIAEEIQNAEEEDDCRLADYFYRLIFLPPFSAFLQNESKQANLVLFSGLLRTFHKYFAYKAITFLNLEEMKRDFFDNFLAFLYIEGLNEEENQHRPLLKGHVQVMTIYQAKGLEFPVVVVGRLDKPAKGTTEERRDLQQYYHQAQFEPENKIAGCDRRRLYYVAFSRPKNLLVLSAQKEPHKDFAPIWNTTPSFSYLYEDFTTMPSLRNTREDRPPKPRYGFTTHIQTYQTCPRRYQFFHSQRFVPSRTRETFFGQLVHQTIERLHRIALEGELDSLDEQQLQMIFEKIYLFAQRTYKRPLSPQEQEQAFRHVLNYYRHNQHRLKNTYKSEHPVQIVHDDYVLNGKIDVLIQDTEGIEILDFKTNNTRLTEDSAWFDRYQQQLYFYASAFSKNQENLPLRLSLYWTAEERLADALVEIPYHPDDIKQTKDDIHQMIIQMQQQQFTIKEPPDPAICKGCDIRYLCQKENIIL
jgi:DNA helicase II / ATP-dependent DNA helicase PcrA